MASASGMSQSAVSMIWRAFGLKPHAIETWKLSSDPQFVPDPVFRHGGLSEFVSNYEARLTVHPLHRIFQMGRRKGGRRVRRGQVASAHHPLPTTAELTDLDLLLCGCWSRQHQDHKEPLRARKTAAKRMAGKAPSSLDGR